MGTDCWCGRMTPGEEKGKGWEMARMTTGSESMVAFQSPPGARIPRTEHGAHKEGRPQRIASLLHPLKRG